MLMSAVSLFFLRNLARKLTLIQLQRVSEWLASQSSTPLPYTVLLGTYYTEMLYASYTPQPSPNDPNLYIFRAPIGTGHFAFVELAQYAKYTRGVFDNPSRSVGRTISLAPYATSLKDIVEAFEKVTGKRAKGEMVTFEESWRGPNLKKKIPWTLNVSGEDEDDTRVTIKQSLGAFFDMWGKILSYSLL
jgi:hypothetical protein